MKAPCIQEESVHLFLDGELSQGFQPELFAHLAACEMCREVMNTMMEFRRMSRQEVIHVPPLADEAVLTTLERSKKRRFQRDRYYERRPLWQARATLSLRMCAVLAVLFFASGIKVAHDVGVSRSLEPLMEQEPEQGLLGPRLEFLYVVSPGLLVEASRAPESVDRQ